MSQSKNSFTNLVELKEKPFCRVYGLWLCPIIRNGSAGGYGVANINHQSFNYSALGELIGDLFWQSAKVQLRLPNDSIDIATFDNRVAEMNSSNGVINSNNLFSDLGKLVMRNANNHENGVIDLRKSKSWLSKKSQFANVDKVYPPMIIPICVLSDRAEDTYWWYMHSLETINNAPLPLVNMARAFAGKPAVNKTNQGVLPTIFLEKLGKMFEVAFEPKAMLVEMASHVS
jgi:hypothetical protein